jgi:hypothetical protein
MGYISERLKLKSGGFAMKPAIAALIGIIVSVAGEPASRTSWRKF